MMNAAIDTFLALPPLLLGLILTWRVIWPKWKVAGKVVAYVAGVFVLSLFIGHWSILVGWLHQLIGFGFHIWFCSRHGFTWYAVENPDLYVQLSKQSVGYKDKSAENG